MNKKEFLNIIDNQKIDIYLQPVISLPGETIAGYEALARGPADSKIFHAKKLFKTAKRYKVTKEIEMCCIQRAIEWAKKMPKRYWTSINVGPELFLEGRFHKLVEKLGKTGLLERIVFELTEHVPFDAKRLLTTLKKLKKIGIRISLDDTGCGFIDMDTVRILRPEIVKLCITITDTIKMDKETIKRLKELVKKANSYGSMVLAEGVKNKKQIEVLKSCRIPLAQGSYYAKPKSFKGIAI